jgi:hypothetical protein
MPPRQFHQPPSAPSTDDIPPLSQHECSQQALLERIEAKLDKIQERLGEGAVNFATSAMRIRALEVITYGGTGSALVYVVNKLLSGVAGSA